MSSVIELTLEKSTMRSLIGATREHLASGLTDTMLLNAAQKDETKLRALFNKISSENIKFQIADHLNTAIDIDPVEIFVTAWSKYSELRERAKETAKEEGSTGIVALAEHEFSYDFGTTLDLVLDRIRIASIPISFAISCKVNGLELFLKAGCVYEIRAGKLAWEAAFQCGGQKFWSRSLGDVDLPGVLHLANPISLLV